jgi:hypothetical protein
MKIHRDVAQGSVEWLNLRAGIVTASVADSLVTPLGKVKTGDAAKTLMMQIIAENWIGGSLPSVVGSFDMEQGKYLEEKARPAFTIETNKPVEEVAFIESDDGRTGCSPDGSLTKETAGLEIKCPKLETHIRYCLDGVVPPDYVMQVQFSLYVTKWPAWYFMSFRGNTAPLIVKVEPDDKIQNAITEALQIFFGNYDAALAKWIKMNGGLPIRKSQFLKPFRPPQSAPADEKFDIY